MMIDYPGSFNIRDTASEINQLSTAANTAPADPRVKAAIDYRIMQWLDMSAEEMAEIVVIAPAAEV